MNYKLSGVLLIIIALAASANADPMEYPYWQMIKDVIRNIESRPPRPLSIGNEPHKMDFEYPFEIFRHLRATDLIRAAREGAEEARLQSAVGMPQAEVDALVLANVVVALEYLPMLIRSNEDWSEFYSILVNRNEDPVLRLYMLEHSFTGFAPPSLLSLSFPELIDQNEKDFESRALQMATHPGENPAIQITAIKIIYARLIREYERNIVEWPSNLPPPESNAADDALKPSAEDIALAKEAQIRHRRLLLRFHDFATAIAGHIAEGSVRDDRVQQETRNILQDMRDKVEEMSKELIDAYLAGKVFSLAVPPPIAFPTPGTDANNPNAPLPVEQVIEQFTQP